MTTHPIKHLAHTSLVIALALTTSGLFAAEQDKPANKPKSPNQPAPPKQPTNPLDNLNSLDDLLKTPAPPSDNPAKDKTADDLDSLLGLPSKVTPAENKKGGDKNIFDDLMAIPENDGGDDFDKAVKNMTDAAARITNDSDLSINTQRHQQNAILSLDKMIAELNKQQQSKKQQKKQQKKDQGEEGNESKPSQPGDQQQQQMTDATQQAGERGEVQEGELNGDAPLAEKLAEWGNLPPHLRDELMQGFEDRFSELYRHLTEQYYKRLAEESQ